jgi:hypothetical protein
MSLQDKTALETHSQDESFTKGENNSSDVDLPITEQEAGDTALANAPWQYKIVALITALAFPCKISQHIIAKSVF